MDFWLSTAGTRPGVGPVSGVGYGQDASLPSVVWGVHKDFYSCEFPVGGYVANNCATSVLPVSARLVRICAIVPPLGVVLDVHRLVTRIRQTLTIVHHARPAEPFRLRKL
jgi:hypothetical protein